MAPDPVTDENQLFDRAYRRVQTLILLLFFCGLAPEYLYGGRASMLWFVLGSALSFLNFAWLRGSATALLERASQQGGNQGVSGMVFRFIARIGAMVAAAYYATILGSRAGIYALAAGLSVGVLALFCEAAYEIYILSATSKSSDQNP